MTVNTDDYVFAAARNSLAILVVTRALAADLRRVSRITDYELVTASVTGVLEKTVRELIEEGFEPFGAPYALPQGYVNVHFQAMVKREGTEAVDA